MRMSPPRYPFLAHILLAVVLIAPGQRCMAQSSTTDGVADFIQMEGFHRAYAAMYVQEYPPSGRQKSLSGAGLEVRQMLNKFTLALRGNFVPTPDGRYETNTALGVEWWPVRAGRLAFGVQSHAGLTNVKPEPDTFVGTEFGYGASILGTLSEHVAISTSLNQISYEAWGTRRQMLIRFILF
jgi:hypothetical protein